MVYDIKISSMINGETETITAISTMLNPDIFFFGNSVDPDQLASSEAN